MGPDTYDKFLTCSILKPGDVAKFRKIDDPALIGRNKKVYQGIIVEVSGPESVGEITYTVFCDDSIVRFFGDYEAIEDVSLVGSSSAEIK